MYDTETFSALAKGRARLSKGLRTRIRPMVAATTTTTVLAVGPGLAGAATVPQRAATAQSAAATVGLMNGPYGPMLAAGSGPSAGTALAPGLAPGLPAGKAGLAQRPDGTEQRTWGGKPLYLYADETIQPSATGLELGGNGNGVSMAGAGTFSLVTP